jgi:hypothetical protein
MSTTQWEAVLAMSVTQDRDHIQGPADAAVTLVQYGNADIRDVIEMMRLNYERIRARDGLPEEVP